MLAAKSRVKAGYEPESFEGWLKTFLCLIGLVFRRLTGRSRKAAKP